MVLWNIMECFVYILKYVDCVSGVEWMTEREHCTHIGIYVIQIYNLKYLFNIVY